MNLMQLFISKIRLDGGTQTRATTDQEVVEEYCEALKAGCEFPPVVVFFDGRLYWLADGFHRLAAYVLACRKAIEADVRKGTQRDAVVFATGANKRHGIKRTNEDKRKAVTILLQLAASDPEVAQQFETPQTKGEISNRKVADHCGVSEHLVRILQEELKEQAKQDNVTAPKSQSGGRAQLARQINEEEHKAILSGKLRRADEHLVAAQTELEKCDVDVAEAIAAASTARKVVERARRLAS